MYLLTVMLYVYSTLKGLLILFTNADFFKCQAYLNLSPLIVRVGQGRSKASPQLNMPRAQYIYLMPNIKYS